MDLDVVTINSFAAVEADGGRMIGREDGEKANNGTVY